ncbi:peptidyl-prolyl cis-trans isomerase B (cyclophilin B) [Micromonospora viridifaciens]|uniref:Peptidyl-prolyl cis-trans isomerase B (Cyclophilin B) n=1 Tax=Micromonospora viridifaciens TaxID=1881 RepID=A0A1C4Z161_MICVI|nr:peptidylprolyl isomerase [Micromonospora viridifaciens]SCF26700.1 peptidyl-prolyl cis-trans isomerase B (cyclophilin B) [Micromonospora viridifaciens]
MTSTRERQRAAARARLEREMAERAAKARKRRQTQAIVGAAAVLVLVVAGTVWLATSLGGDDDKQQNTATAGYSQCVYTEVPKEGRPKQIKDVGLPPNQQANKGTQTMTIDTNLGPITAKLNRDQVPCTAGSFTHLASKGFFDNTKCHRLVTEGIKVLQCGDPSATGNGWRDTDGTGGPSYGLAEENLPTDKRPPYPDGVIAMANSGAPGSTGSQFFIVYGDSQLDPNYTVLGTITGGMDVVKQVAAAGDDGAFAQQAGGGHPKKEIVINKLTMSDIQGA